MSTDNRKYVQGKDYFLSGSGVSASDTTVVLASMQFPNGDLIQMTDFGLLGYLTIDPETDNEENISFTGLTQNGNGTATLSGVTRGLRFNSPYTSLGSLAQAHAGGARCRVTNSAPWYSEFANKLNDETVENTWIFSAVPSSPTSPVAAADVANKAYVDSVVAGGGTISELIVPGGSQDTIIAGNTVYFDTATNGWKRTSASTLATVSDVLLGIAQGAGNAGFPIANGVLVNGCDTNQSGLTPGAIYYYSNSLGGISTTPGTNRVAIGVARTATDLYFEPNFDSRVTPQDLQNETYVYAADSGAADAYVITLVPAPSAYATGQKFAFKATNTNTGTSTINVNSLGVKTIKKSVSVDLVAGDITAGQIVEVTYDGTNFQLTSSSNQGAIPAVTVIEAVATTTFGDSDSQFDITGAGSVWTYTWDGTGTNPGISAITIPTGSTLRIYSSGFTASNSGIFPVTASGSSFFTVTNSGGTAQTNKTISSNGFIEKINSQTYTKPTGLKYISVRLVGAGGGGSWCNGSSDDTGAGGAAGGYSEKIIDASSLGATEDVYIGNGGYGGLSILSGTGVTGFSTLFGAILSATGGEGGAEAGNGGIGGIGIGGDINIGGQGGGSGNSVGTGSSAGGTSMLGGGANGVQEANGAESLNYGGGGSGGDDNNNDRNGGDGANGVIIVTEYYS